MQLKKLKDIFDKSINELEEEFDSLFDKYGHSHFFKNAIFDLNGTYLSLKKSQPKILMKLGALEYNSDKHYEWTEEFKKEAFLENYGYVIMSVIEFMNRTLAEYELYISSQNKENSKLFLETKLDYYLANILKNEHHLAYHKKDFREKESDFYSTRFMNKLDVPYSLSFENEEYQDNLIDKIFINTIPHTYGDILVDVETWIDMEIASKMTDNLNQVLKESWFSFNPKKTITESDNIPIKFINPFFFEGGEELLFEILLKTGAISKLKSNALQLGSRFRGVCGYLFDTYNSPNHQFLNFNSKTDFMYYLNSEKTYNAGFKNIKSGVICNTETRDRQEPIVSTIIKNHFPKLT